MSDMEFHILPTPEWMKPSGRKHQRVDLHASLAWRLVDLSQSPDTPFKTGQVMDLSIGGLMFKASSKLEKGQKVQLRLSVAEILAKDADVDPLDAAANVDLDVIAEIRQVEERLDGTRLYGVRFRDVIQGDMDALKAFIDKHS